MKSVHDKSMRNSVLRGFQNMFKQIAIARVNEQGLVIQEGLDLIQDWASAMIHHPNKYTGTIEEARSVLKRMQEFKA